MGSTTDFDSDRRRQIYEYVERNGAVDPETARRNLLVQAPSNSKPARSGAELDPSIPMPPGVFAEHVAGLEDEGYLAERDGKLRVAHPVEADATTVTVEDVEDDGIEDAEATVRAAVQEDIEGIVDVVETIAVADEYVVASRLASDVTREEVLLRQNDREDRVFFVATVDDEIVGWLHVEAVQVPMMDHTAQLTVGVLEAYRGHGIGSTLMEHGLDWARDRGLRKVYQNVPASNERAIAFLENAGWAVESTREDHYCIDDAFVDEAQLAIWLE
ncbi:GNAT family N-acetyltransferase [Halorubellus sp. JP-L1]|uniref:GNAT family N-acetyltransferase n=1 Tax=Halorubellus sp. JP-L1 TaxID=2715753 RepID=UPI001407855A|nr:GNAT family N-acetyltransferase [Halorubellus sp. JP-L1]NHN40655.1 GNAT family N-acetyltransferase [Halorubellus sp. JP-L1]